VAPPAALVAESEASPAAGHVFARRVTAVLSTKVVAFGITLATTIIVSRILGSDGKGSLTAIISLPVLLGAFALFGLPNAVNYFAARGTSVRGLMLAGFLFTAILSAALMSIVWILLPWLETTFFSDAREYDYLLRAMVFAVPPALLSTFLAAILYGRQQVRTYSMILVGQGLLTFSISVVLVAVFRWGVTGAVTTSIVVLWVLALADLVAVARLVRREPPGNPVSYRKLVGYGGRIYPSSITGYFNYRIDVYLLQFLQIAKGPLGLYTFSVTMAELVFYVPDSITMIFLPRVAGTTQANADEMLVRVARLTALITILGALALIPAAWVGINLILPTTPNKTSLPWIDCFPAFLILLPAVVSLSLAKVMTSYISGRGRPGSVALGAAVSLVVNVVANLLLIPRFGIEGAATASLVSYTTHAALMISIACRISHHSPLTVIVPRMGEVRTLWSTSVRIARQLRDRVARSGATHRTGARPADQAK
jgi:O-antigen/teichoic acid export membrane protein